MQLKIYELFELLELKLLAILSNKNKFAISDAPNDTIYMVCGVVIAMLLVGLIIILVAVTIKYVSIGQLAILSIRYRIIRNQIDDDHSINTAIARNALKTCLVLD